MKTTMLANRMWMCIQCLLLIHLSAQFVCGNLAVTDGKNRTLWDAPDLPARFGAAIPQEGLWGHLFDAHSDGCEEKYLPSPPAGTDEHWIALIARGQCQFDLKVLNAQKKHYYAAIIYNDESDNLIPMGAGDHSKDVKIPSAFIGLSDAQRFKKYQDAQEYTFWLDLRMTFNYWPLMKDFLIIASAAFAFGLCVGLAVLGIRWVRDIRHRQRSRLSSANLKKIPIKKYQKGDQYDMCAICLDEYEIGEKLRVLPCSHSYHQKCIDPWLTKNKKTCPICKRKVIPGDDCTDSESDEDDASHSENTPLLGAGGGGSGGLSRGGGTFDSSGLGSTVRNQEHPLSLSDSSSEASYSMSTSNYQSSVEVHVYANPDTVADSDSEGTQSADSDDDLLCPDHGAAGGVVDPAVIVISQDCTGRDEAVVVCPAAGEDSFDYRPLAEDDGLVQVALNNSNERPRDYDQIV